MKNSSKKIKIIKNIKLNIKIYLILNEIFDKFLFIK